MKIKNLNTYNKSMSKCMNDKLFFINKVNANSFIDFGCADGAMINNLSKLMPNKKFIGYDNNADMLNKISNEENKIFTNNFNTINEVDSCLVLSSVVHEIYSYCSENEIKNIWKGIFNLSPKFIVIRDMMISKDANRITKEKISVEENYINDWTTKWGSLNNNQHLLHFILTYRYHNVNWERELNENYFPIYLEDFIKIFPNNYKIKFIEHYKLPFLFHETKMKYDIEIKDNTHIKIILQRV